MAKALLKTRVKKTVRKTQSETYLVNRKYMGDEPEPGNGVILRTDLARALTWYGMMCDTAEARTYINSFLKDNELTNMIRTFKRVPDKYVPLTAAWIMRMASREIEFEGDTIERAIEMVLAANAYAEAPAPTETVVKPTIQERMAEKISEFIGDVEAIVDAPEADFSMYTYLQSKELPAKYAAQVAEYYKPIVEELELAVARTDKQVNEGYDFYTKKSIINRLKFIQSIVDDCEKYAGNVRKQRAPRKKKTVSAEKKLKLFPYLKQDNTHQLTSISPNSILGAQELWTFDTKKNLLTYYAAAGPAGLDVSRTSVAGFDPDKSKTLKIGRKTKETLATVTSGGKIVIRRLIETMNGSPSGRSNEFTILLKKS